MIIAELRLLFDAAMCQSGDVTTYTQTQQFAMSDIPLAALTLQVCFQPMLLLIIDYNWCVLYDTWMIDGCVGGRGGLVARTHAAVAGDVSVCDQWSARHVGEETRYTAPWGGNHWRTVVGRWQRWRRRCVGCLLLLNIYVNCVVLSSIGLSSNNDMLAPASLNAAVRRLTSPENYDNKFMKTFITTYQSFTEPWVLLVRLLWWHSSHLHWYIMLLCVCRTN